MIITSNDPSAGYVSWSGVTIKYKGVTYTIADDNSNEPFIWWDFTTPTVFLDSATMPTLTDNDFVAIYNDSGTYQLAGIRSRQVHGAMIMDGTIPAAALEETYVETTGNETVAGIKTFSSSPIVPTPTTDMQASTKKYADEAAPAAHKDSHDPEDGSDPLDTAAPENIDGVQVAAVGTAHTFARADHDHRIQAAIADDAIVTVDQVTPVATDYARFTANGLEGREASEVISDLSLDTRYLVLTGGTLSGDLLIYDPVNDGNPQLRIGSDDANEGHIQAVYDSGAQTLDYLNISTDSAGEGDICINAASGFHGIGTTTPNASLDVGGGSQISGAFYQALLIQQNTALIGGLKFENSNAAGQIRLLMRADDGDYGMFTIGGSTSAGSWAGVNRPDGVFLLSQNAGRALVLATIVAEPIIFGINNVEQVRISANDRVSIGAVAAPLAKLHVDQPVSDAAIPVLTLDQADESEGFINFKGTSAGSAVGPISTWTAGNAINGFVAIEINGTRKWMPYYTDPTS